MEVDVSQQIKERVVQQVSSLLDAQWQVIFKKFEEEFHVFCEKDKGGRFHFKTPIDFMISPHNGRFEVRSKVSKSSKWEEYSEVEEIDPNQPELGDKDNPERTPLRGT